jgi:hypothetical protein
MPGFQDVEADLGARRKSFSIAVFVSQYTDLS